MKNVFTLFEKQEKVPTYFMQAYCKWNIMTGPGNSPA